MRVFTGGNLTLASIATRVPVDTNYACTITYGSFFTGHVPRRLKRTHNGLERFGIRRKYNGKSISPALVDTAKEVSRLESFESSRPSRFTGVCASSRNRIHLLRSLSPARGGVHRYTLIPSFRPRLGGSLSIHSLAFHQLADSGSDSRFLAADQRRQTGNHTLGYRASALKNFARGIRRERSRAFRISH